VYGSPKIAAYHRKALNVNNFSFNTIRKAEDANAKKANIINCNDDAVRVELGKSTKESGLAAFEALEQATRDLLAGQIDVVVTAPINKANIQSKDFNFPGQTEYFEENAGEGEALMLLVGEKLRVGVVTGHLPLKKVSETLTKELILSKIRILNQTLIQDFGIRKPQIAVLGLNPHSGDNGLLGSEEIDIIIPAIEAAREEKIMALGPYPADGLFGASNLYKFDAILAMYHDQGLTPFKALEFESGVNFTAGLPIIRTSPDHGTAFDIAGKDVANHESFLRAIYLACDVYNNRTGYLELLKNAMDNDEIKKSISKFTDTNDSTIN
jgi:4-hydroxythreonine-4-phosphate dehydrogenase